MLKKSLPAYSILIAVFVGAIVPSYFLIKPKLLAKNSAKPNICSEYKIARLTGYKFVKPIVSAETACESKRYDALKSKIGALIQDFTKQGKLHKASVYLRDFHLGEWTFVGENERFTPGSLIKVPIMMAILKASEKNPNLLNEKLKLAAPVADFPTQNIVHKSIEYGKEYSVKELLKYMIAYSDNNATILLSSKIDAEAYKKMFIDLGSIAPEIEDAINFKISAKEYSMFIKALYNASYLNIDNSEYAVSLLGESTFKDGLSKGLPSEIKIAHKFGESGTDLEPQLHESGVIYSDNTTYMLTVMTKGKKMNELSEFLAAVSALSYTEIKNMKK